jgi:hypothetical protein
MSASHPSEAEGRTPSLTSAEYEFGAALMHYEEMVQKHPNGGEEFGKARRRVLELFRLAARSPAPSDDTDEDGEYDEAHAVALQVLCRVFEDGADVAIDEWREWYKPEQWLWHARGLGSFIASRLAEKRELTTNERGAFERLQSAMQLVSGKSKPVEITMRDANCLVHAIATPPRAAPSVEARDDMETAIAVLRQAGYGPLADRLAARL